MKILLVAVALFVAVEVESTSVWGNHYNNPGNRRGNYYNNPGPGGERFHPSNYPLNEFGPNVEWVCRNPKTNDMMLVTADQAPQRNPGRGSGFNWLPNYPLEFQKHNHWIPNGYQWTRPIIIVEEESTGNGVDNNDNQLPSPTPSTSIPSTSETHVDNNNNNNNNRPQTTLSYHGGEGIIEPRSQSNINIESSTGFTNIYES